MSGRQSSQDFTFATIYSSVVSRCRGHYGALTVWLCDIVDIDYIRALHPNIRCVIPIITNSSHNTGGARHL
jgi:hypothetical protein